MKESLADKVRAFGRVLFVDDVESILSIPSKTIYDMAKADRIPSFKVGKRVCFDPFHLADWYESKARAGHCEK